MSSDAYSLAKAAPLDFGDFGDDFEYEEPLGADIFNPFREHPSLLGSLTGTSHAAPTGSRTVKFTKRLKNPNGEVLTVLEDATVTVTKMTAPATGLPFLNINFSYLITSHGWRTGMSADEAPSLTQGMYFNNDDGGAMYTWGFPYQDISIRCDSRRVHRLHRWSEERYVSWFDLWNGRLKHQVTGSMYPC
jgi:hypothetical protein